jgi:ArsR family transcriptional regulator
MDNLEKFAAMFRTLGDPTRLKIFEYLHGCIGPVSIDETGDVRRVSGPTVGEICCHIHGTDRVSSTMSFHLKELRQAGLIIMQKSGKHIFCSINPEASAILAKYLLDPHVRDSENGK